MRHTVIEPVATGLADWNIEALWTRRLNRLPLVHERTTGGRTPNTVKAGLPNQTDSGLRAHVATARFLSELRARRGRAS
jgi:hypothetical protein